MLHGFIRCCCERDRPRRRAVTRPGGFTLLELLLALAVGGTLASMAIPVALRALDDYRARAAATYLAHRLAQARIEAIKRSCFVGVRFAPDAADYAFATVADGNDNGLRTSDITGGVDFILTSPERLCWHFSDVTCGILPGVPDADGAPSGGPDGVRVGASRIVSMNPNGSATSGTIYLHGRYATQYAVRILGATGRVRILKYLEGARRWIDQ